ncbi:GNAT family N-acetyltransferase [Streptococcus pacificus]|uniref:GNAT family N-acetyltransferase n=1 Tax=Streptococcus pacificus TaxID=2740577 RepID=A0ABS0ZL28_9STRE|nr:GNAT family N-acetyltransferase [Streptococcus pacificus]MBJ8326251.1 GNAT family N-acetyltransferase [Streptococcus pacificus]
MEIKYTLQTNNTIYQDALRIRREVFVKEQGVSETIEIDDKEDKCLHFVLYNDDQKAVATARLFPNANHQVILQRMAVLKAFRGQHWGQILLKQMLEIASQQHYQEMILHAQLTAKAFYQKLGFTAFGEIFEEAGIKHISMKKNLSH